MTVYEMVTSRIISELENNRIPWRKPWTGTRAGAYNRINKRPYSLMNQLLLKNDGEYATYKQWHDLGGQVRKGEKSEFVVFWKIDEKITTNENGEEVKKQSAILRYYNVFHISQVDGVESLPTESLNDINPIESAEQLKESYKARERIQILETISNEAFYSPTRDYIQVPCLEQYTAPQEFYSTLFHEMIHSTGHKTRLNRLDGSANAAFGSETYSKEELVAELGSAMILNLLGIETTQTFNNSTAYIKNWLTVLRNDPRFIVSAASKAEKAVQYIMA